MTTLSIAVLVSSAPLQPGSHLWLMHTCKMFWKLLGLSYIGSGEGRGKKVPLPWGGCPCGVLLISLLSGELRVGEPGVCLLCFCGALPLRFELVGSQASVIVIVRETEELFDLAEILPLGGWFVLSLCCSFRAKVELSSSSAVSARSS